MVTSYNITVKNQSGNQQQYALFNKPPIVNANLRSRIWSNVFADRNISSGSTTTFTFYNQYRAIVGTFLDSPEAGARVMVTGDREIALGSTKIDGSYMPGTTLQLVVADKAPQFSSAPLREESYRGAFIIQTANDFTIAEAIEGRYFIGLGGSSSGQNGSVVATFTPDPNVRYQIQPSNTYYLAVGRYTEGAIVDLATIGGTLAIDFTRLPSDDVVIVHDEHGNLKIQA